MLHYETPSWVRAYSTGKGEELDEARCLGLGADFALPRQTHSAHVQYVCTAGRPDDTDAVFTDVPGLCIAVKTADCIPVLLFDHRLRRVAAIHAGWKGTVQYIVAKTIEAMGSEGVDLSAIIGPGISLESFEVGNEVYDRFLQAGFPMGRIARWMDDRWHIDLPDANRWQLEQCGVSDIHLAATAPTPPPRF